MKRYIRFIDKLSLLLVAWAMAALIPVNWIWFSPNMLLVSDSVEGSNVAPAIKFDRNIKIPVVMSYQVIIRNISGNGSVCDTEGGPFTYRPDAEFPSDADLIWWVGGAEHCWPLDPGTYIVETCWTVVRPFYGLVPPKTICIESNTFTIHPRVETQK